MEITSTYTVTVKLQVYYCPVCHTMGVAEEKEPSPYSWICTPCYNKGERTTMRKTDFNV